MEKYSHENNDKAQIGQSEKYDKKTYEELLKEESKLKEELSKAKKPDDMMKIVMQLKDIENKKITLEDLAHEEAIKENNEIDQKKAEKEKAEQEKIKQKEEFDQLLKEESKLKEELSKAKKPDDMMKIVMQLKDIENKKITLEDLAHEEAIKENNEIDQKKAEKEKAEQEKIKQKEEFDQLLKEESKLKEELSKAKKPDDMMKIVMQLKDIENKKNKLEDLAHEAAIKENKEIDQKNAQKEKAEQEKIKQKEEFYQLLVQDQKKSGKKIEDIIAQINGIDAQNADTANNKQPDVQSSAENSKDGNNIPPHIKEMMDKLGADEMTDFDEDGIARVKKGEKWFLVNKKGENIFGKEFGHIGEFREGIAPVLQDNGEWIYIDKKGNNIFNESFDYAENLRAGTAIVKTKDGQWFYINKNGERKKGEYLQDIGEFQDGMIRVQKADGLYYYLDEQFDQLNKDGFHHAENFSDGYAVVGQYTKNIATGDRTDEFYIDKNGNKLIIKEPHSTLYPFHNGIARVSYTDKDHKTAYYYIDKNGNKLPTDDIRLKQIDSIGAQNTDTADNKQPDVKSSTEKSKDDKVDNGKQNIENGGIDIGHLKNEYKQIYDKYIQQDNDIDKSIQKCEEDTRKLVNQIFEIAKKYNMQGNYIAAAKELNFEDLKKFIADSGVNNEFNNKTQKEKDDIIKNLKHLGDEIKNIESEIKEFNNQKDKLSKEFNNNKKEYYKNTYKYYNYSDNDMSRDKNNIHEKFDTDYFGVETDVDRKILNNMLGVELPIFSNAIDKDNSKYKFKAYFNKRTNKNEILFFGNGADVNDIIKHNRRILDQSRKDINQLAKDIYNKFGDKENVQKAMKDIIEKHRLEYDAAKEHISGIEDMFNTYGSDYNYKYGLPATDGMNNVNPKAIFNMLFIRKFLQEDNKKDNTE